MQRYGRAIDGGDVGARLLCVVWAGAEAFEPVRTTVTGEDQFGDIMLDLEQIDLEYGDSVDLAFSGGRVMNAVPYYPDFLAARAPPS